MSQVKNEKTRLALKDYKLLQDDNQGVKFVKELLTAMNEKDAAGNTPLKTSMNSILLRSIFTGAVTSANIGIELIIPNSILETENGQIVNIIQKDELVNVIENLLVIMPEGDEINKTELINETLSHLPDDGKNINTEYSINSFSEISDVVKKMLNHYRIKSSD